MHLYIMVVVIHIHDIRDKDPRHQVSFFQLYIMCKFIDGIFITVQGVFELCVSIGFQKIIQGVQAECLDGMFFAGG